MKKILMKKKNANITIIFFLYIVFLFLYTSVKWLINTIKKNKAPERYQNLSEQEK